MLLLGGSGHDNLFNHPDVGPDGLASHLDLLVNAGGNYIRNTMSSRDQGNLWAFHQRDDGRYDLDRWNDAYWKRFEQLLQLTPERGIIVQIELWDTHDFYDRGGQAWEANPFNPANNINYTAEESGLTASAVLEAVDQQDNPFFLSVPQEQDRPGLLRYQKRFVDKVMEVALAYDHVLYCISNETWASVPWSHYWIDHVRSRADKAGKYVPVTEMWLKVRHDTFDGKFPEHYTFVDVSQNNGSKRGDLHWQMLQSHREEAGARPVNNGKIYGAGEPDWAGDTAEAGDKFWRNVLGGAASARFHRPEIGLGLSDRAQAHIRSARLLADAFDLFNATADRRHSHLHYREANSAYQSHVGEEQYALYFPNGASVELNLEAADGTFHLKWLNVLESQWNEESQVQAGAGIELTPPSNDPWVAVLKTNK